MAGKRILVVEDEANIRTLLQMRCRLAGYQAQTASDGTSGFEVAKQFKPDLVLTDHRMPAGMSGAEMAKAIKGLPGMADVPVIILTGSRAVSSGLHAELDGLRNITALPKPFSVREVFGLVGQLLQPTDAQEEDEGGSA